MKKANTNTGISYAQEPSRKMREIFQLTATSGVHVGSGFNSDRQMNPERAHAEKRIVIEDSCNIVRHERDRRIHDATYAVAHWSHALNIREGVRRG